MAFNLSSFEANPTIYLGTKQFVTPGTSVDLDHKAIEARQVLGSMEVATFSNQLSQSDFAVAESSGKYLLTSADSGGDLHAYWLPWKSGRAYKMKLGQKCTLFITAKMNSCGIIIGGDRSTPVVMHANTEDVTTPDFNPAVDDFTSWGVATRQLQTAEYKLHYGNLAAAAISSGVFGTGSPNVSVVDPEFYLTDRITSMSVFGIRLNGGPHWTFFANLHGVSGAGKTLEIWPKQPTTLPSM